MNSIPIMATNSRINYHTYHTRTYWRSVDAHFQNVAGSVVCTLLPIKAANTLFMNVRNESPIRLSKMEVQKLLTLCSHSFSRWGREHISFLFVSNASNYIKKRQWCTKLNILRLTVGYLNAPIHRKTPKAERKIYTDQSSRTLQNFQVSGDRSVNHPLRGCGLGSRMGLGLIRNVFVIRSQIAGCSAGPVGYTITDTERACCDPLQINVFCFQYCTPLTESSAQSLETDWASHLHFSTMRHSIQ